MSMKTKDHCGKLGNEACMSMKKIHLSIARRNIVENKGGYTRSRKVESRGVKNFSTPRLLDSSTCGQSEIPRFARNDTERKSSSPTCYNPLSQISKARRTAWALARHSWCSRAGT